MFLDNKSKTTIDSSAAVTKESNTIAVTNASDYILQSHNECHPGTRVPGYAHIALLLQDN